MQTSANWIYRSRTWTRRRNGDSFPSDDNVVPENLTSSATGLFSRACAAPLYNRLSISNPLSGNTASGSSSSVSVSPALWLLARVVKTKLASRHVLTQLPAFI